MKGLRTKIGNREKHQGKHWKLGKLKMKHEETYGKIGENVGPFSHQFSSSFIPYRIHPRMNAEYPLWPNQYIAVNFFHDFLTRMVSYAKFILMAIGGKCASVIFVLLFSWRINHPYADIRNVMKYLNIWFNL